MRENDTRGGSFCSYSALKVPVLFNLIYLMCVGDLFIWVEGIECIHF